MNETNLTAEELIRILKMMFRGKIDYRVKIVISQKNSGAIYLQKKYRGRNAIVFFETDEIPEKGTQNDNPYNLDKLKNLDKLPSEMKIV